MSSAIDKIRDDAIVAAAEQVKIPNMLYVAVMDPHTLRLTTVIHGRVSSWIEFSASQMDDILRIIHEARSRIT